MIGCFKAMLLCALTGAAAFFVYGGHPVAVIGFEEWNEAKGQPAGEDWRWGFSQRGTNGFAVCELSEAERHGGRASLHLKDTDNGRFNHTMWYQFTKNDAKAMEGKVMRASAWIKQVSASDPPAVGIALFAKGDDGRTVYVRNGVGTTGVSDWINVQVALNMPVSVKSARLVINCSNGYGNTGEMYIDDIVVSQDQADHPILEPRSPSVDQEWNFSLPTSADAQEVVDGKHQRDRACRCQRVVHERC